MERSPQTRILVVARRDPQEPIGGMLKRAGYAVTWADGLPTAARYLDRSPFDLVVVHIPFIGHPVFARVRSLAEEHGLPLLALEVLDGDDPEQARRALAEKIEAVLAERSLETGDLAKVVAGDLSLDLARHAAHLRGRSLALTPREFDLLHHLARRPGWVWSRQQLLEQAWGYEVGDLRVVTVHIGNLRRKLGQAHPGQTYIETVRGVGYRLVEPASFAGEPRSAASADAHAGALPRLAGDRAPFVGREAELAALRRCMAAAATGQVRMVGVAGEAGIGKTRLAEEFSAYTSEAGFEVWWGCCHEGRIRAAYEPWVDILEAWEHKLGNGYLERVFGKARPEPTLSRREGRYARLQLFQRLVEAIRVRAAEVATCLVLEDFHWADTSTLLALQYVVRHLRDVPLLLILTYRPFEWGPEAWPSHLLGDVVAEVARSDEGFVLSLVPLSHDEVSRFVGLFGLDRSASAAADLSAEIYQQTEGNPFFVTQILRLLKLRPGGAGGSLPHLGQEEGVRSVILQRLSSLSGPCRQWLEGGSVCGREFSGTVAAELTGVTSTALSGLMTEASGARLVVINDDAPGRYRFGHSIIRDVLYEGLAPDSRARMHARVAAILERHYEDELDNRAGELAHHYYAGVSAGSAERAFEFCLRAGDQAARHCAWEEACAHWARAVGLIDLFPVGGPQRSAALLARVYEDMGDAYGLEGDAERMVQAYESAAAHLPAEDRVSLARVKRKQMIHLHQTGQHDLALSRLVQAEMLLGPPDDGLEPDWWREWIEVELSRARHHCEAGEFQEADVLLARVGSAAESHGTDRQMAECDMHRWLVDMKRRRFRPTAGTMQMAERCARGLTALASPLDLQDAQMVLGATLLQSHDQRALAGEHLRRFFDLTRQSHDLVFQLEALGMLCTWHRLRGDVVQVRRYASELLSLLADRPIVAFRARALGDLAWAAWREGDHDEAGAQADAGIKDLEARSSRQPFEWRVRWPSFGLSLESGALVEAKRQVEAMLDPSQEKMPDDLEEQMRQFLRHPSLGGQMAERTADDLASLARTYGYL